jgi:hypothetical protein
MNPTNEERRKTLCAQHANLRKTIEETRIAALASISGDLEAAQLLAAVAKLERQMLQHLADEEKLLGPILGTIDAWGSVRLGLLRAEHAHQRAVLAVLGEHGVAVGAERVVAARTLALCEELLVDMEFEERELFNEKVLRDDCILLDASDA